MALPTVAQRAAISTLCCNPNWVHVTKPIQMMPKDYQGEDRQRDRKFYNSCASRIIAYLFQFH